MARPSSSPSAEPTHKNTNDGFSPMAPIFKLACCREFHFRNAECQDWMYFCFDKGFDIQSLQKSKMEEARLIEHEPTPYDACNIYKKHTQMRKKTNKLIKIKLNKLKQKIHSSVISIGLVHSRLDNSKNTIKNLLHLGTQQ
jgi:hypothetical protein